MKKFKINVGCGRTPTTGYLNFDNSFSLRISKINFLSKIASRFSLLNQQQYEYLKFCKENDIQYANAVKKIPLNDSSVEILYTSHMVEHLDRLEVKSFLKESKRVLINGGVIRIVIPDLEKIVNVYVKNHDADAFMSKSLLYFDKPNNFLSKVKFLIVGARHHLWMYDKKSISKLLLDNGFKDPKILEPGSTTVNDPGELNLHEKEDESIFIEAIA